MLDAETKRKIDTARDILVGKVPDPKSQVEQITIALIYKFMDDMDQESVAMGGKASFFAGEYARYSWSNIFDPRLGGYEMLALYSEALTKMDTNPGLPQLFRDIFKNAYLPYRDPETLKLFLKTINEFQYDQSERLGDAFEYLLQVMGSQGSAGQFLTPRHIINFMVQVVDPQKNETILDPACGTAGFLISAYRYILNQNSTNKTEGYANGWSSAGDKLTNDEKTAMMDHFHGYDISPDMVRLSRANLYLHGFQQPKIEEYDTLTSEEKWGEMADVILANPPFMSPKGGIRPHKKFMVESSRSEVLFVDYITEHLTPNGRGAVIVPEGIIFQSGNAYKQLRKYLVEQNILWAVVSLPAGVFNPYSGVKTSILFFDRVLAKKMDSILFVKIEYDGFDLGAQRKPIEKNDFPSAVKSFDAWKKSLVDFANPIDKFVLLKKCQLILKSSLAQNNDYFLNQDRYTQTILKQNRYPLEKLGDFCTIISGQSPNGKFYNKQSEGMPFFQGKTEFTDRYLGKATTWTTEITKIAEPDDILISVRAPVGPVNIVKEKICIGRGLAAIRPDNQRADFNYVFELLRNMQDEIKGNSGSTFASINRNDISEIKVPLPSLEVQHKIVAEIEGYQRIIDGARQVVENWKPNIEMELEEARKEAGVEEWEMVRLGEVCEFRTGGTPTSTKKEYYENGDVPWLVSGDIHLGEIFNCEGRITELGVQNSNAKLLPKNSVLIALNGQGKTRGTVALLRMDNATCNQSLVSMMPSEKSNLFPEFLFHIMKFKYQEIRNITGDNQRSGLNIPILKSIEIPLPYMDVQESIIRKIQAENDIVDLNKKLIDTFEVRIKRVVERIWEG
jgi:type I restriction enzyme M protein